MISVNKFINLVVVMMFLSVLFASAQKKDLNYYQCAFFESYQAGSVAPWPGLIAEMEKVKPASLEWQIEMLKAMYGLIGYQIGSKNKDSAQVYVNMGAVLTNELLDDYPNSAQLHCLAGTFCAYKILLAFYKAPILGPEYFWHINKAIELDPTEPWGYFEKGNSLAFRPAILGGNNIDALVYYRKALKLSDSQNKAKCNWQALTIRAFILRSLYETNQNEEAKAFNLEIQKDYGSMDWIQQFVGIADRETVKSK